MRPVLPYSPKTVLAHDAISLPKAHYLSTKSEKESVVNEELIEAAGREILSWPGVSKEDMRGGTGKGGFQVPPATVYRFGRRHLGHIHVTGVADITFPRRIHDELVSEGRAIPHPAGFDDVVSYRIRKSEDVPNVVELFRKGYELAKASAERREALQARRAG